LKKACLRFTDNVLISDEQSVISSADGVILPGVGAFQAGMDGLKKRGLTQVVKKFASTGKPMLGICLGAQLMLEEGHEFGKFKGLGMIPGKVVIFPKLKDAKIPHIGWNTFSSKKQVVNGKEIKPESKGTILDSIDDGAYVYFVHSYILKPSKKDHVLAETTYGGYTFCSAVKSGNIYGTQFHPEKSGEVGLKIIGNFVKLTGK
jgi:imidazole glycerol-phosphate synthase subunit HisH